MRTVDARPTLALGLAWLVSMSLALAAGCSTDRVVDGDSERFACFNNSDCVTNYSCFCGFCQPLGGPQRCLTDVGPAADAGKADSGATDSGATDSGATDSGTTDSGTTDTGTTDTGTTDTGTTDTGTTDTGSGVTPADCDPVDWSGCPAGQGCYWNDAISKTVCQAHGALGQNASCDPSALSSCGKSASGAPLLCDGVDQKCYPLCRAGSSTCPAGETCYALQDADKKPWPKQTGICAK